jgi:hypothetical protein
MDKYYERPFVQLCYTSASKLLYYSYVQTLDNSVENLKRLKKQETYQVDDTHMHMDQDMTEEVKKDKDVEMEEEKDFFPSSASKINSNGS